MDKKWQVFILVAVSIFMSTLDSSIVNLALPYMMKDLSRTMGDIQWVVTVYLLIVSSFLLTFGRLSDIAGRLRIYRIGFCVFTLGSFFCGISQNLTQLVISRAVQGMGAAMLMACSPALITDVFEPRSRGKALGLVGACVAAGLTLGPVAGGILLEYFSWPMIFYINIPVGLAALAGSRMVPDIQADLSREPMDTAGSLLMVVCLGGVVLGLVRLHQWGVFSLWGAGCWAAGILAGIGSVIHTARASHPLIDPALFRVRLFVLPLAASFFLFMALFTLVFIMPFYLSLACGFPPARTGMVMIIPFLFLLVVAPVSGALSDRLGSLVLCGAGMGCLTLSLTLTAALAPPQGMAAIFWRMALAGFGTALFISPNTRVVMGAVPAGHRGIASGALATARNLGMVMGVALASGVFTYTFTGLTRGKGLDLYTPDMLPFFITGFKLTMAVGAGAALLGFGLTLARGPESGV